MSKALATKNVAAVLVACAIVFGFAFAFAAPAKADTLSDLQAQVQALLAQIAALQGSSSTSTGAGCHTFTQNLTVGNTGGEVAWVQQFLNGHGAQVSATGAGSPGNESSYFGTKTRAAVAAFQTANGITPTAGYWGPITRAKANAICAGTTTTGPGPVTPTGPGITISASAQPANSLAPQGAARVPFTTFTLTNNTGAAVTVTGIVVQRTGLAQDAVFSGLALVDSTNIQIGISKTLNSNHQATVGDTFTLNAGETKTLTVVGNMAASEAAYAGQVVAVSVVGVNTTVPVNGTLPITGAQQTINATLSIGSVSTSTSSYDPGAAQTRNIGDTGVRFSGIKFTASSAEDLKLYSIRWRQVGSAASSDLTNVVTIVNGTSYPTVVSADGKYFTTVFPGGILIAKGDSIDAYVQGDITGSNSANRTAEFDIDKVTDVYFVGQLYGYGIAPSGTYTPWYHGYVVTINPGTATVISKATEVAAQNIAANVPNQVLGGFATNFSGESVSVQGMVFQVATSSGFGASPLTSVSIVDENGVVVAGPVDEVAAGTLTFSDTVTFPTGRHVYTVKGKVPSGAPDGGTVVLSTTPSSNWSNPTGQVSGSTITLPSTAVTMNTMTVKAGAISVSMSSSPASQNVVAGTQGFVFANEQLDASQSGEDVRVASLPINFAGDPSYLTGCQLWDGTTALNTGSRVVNTLTSGAKNTFTLDNTLTVTKGSVKSLGIACNLSSAATTSTYRFSVDTTTSDYAFTGVTSGNTITPNGGTIATSNGGLMTKATGSFTVSVDPSSPSYALGAGGTNGVTMAVVKLRASNEAINVSKIGLTIANGTATAYTDLGTVYLYNSSNVLIGTATFTGSNTTATSTLSSTLLVSKDIDTKITIKADLADISSSGAAVAGDLIVIDPLNAEGSGAGSGSTLLSQASSGVAGVRIFNSFPTLAQDTLTTSGVADGRLLRFKITANAQGDVGLAKMKFSVATSTITNVTNFSLWGFTDSGYSSGISGQASGGQIDGTLATSSGTGCVSTNNTANGSSCTLSSGVASLTFKTAAATPVEVPAGSTYYFELRGSVSGTQTGSSVVTTMLGDTTFDGMKTVGNLSASNFVWSGNSTTTSTGTMNDWSNGAGLIGLPSSGIVQARSN